MKKLKYIFLFFVAISCTNEVEVLNPINAENVKKIAELQSQLSLLSSSLSDLQNQNQNLTYERNSLREQVTYLQLEISDLDLTNTSLESQIESLLIKVSQLELDIVNISLTVKQINYDYKVAYCLEGEISSTIWLGEKLGIVIEGETPSDRDPIIMNKIIKTLERITNQFYLTTQIGSLNKYSSYENRMLIEVVKDNCGAAGLAHHGVLGISVGDYFLNEVYNSFLSGEGKMHQIFYYELNRNFWKPKWIKKFDWVMDKGNWDWGHWTTGFNVAQAIIMPQQLDIGFIYFGWTLDQFRDKMMNNLNTYMENDEYNFENGWMQSAMPWDKNNSVNDLMTGLIIYSYENFGGDDWLMNFYKYLDGNEITDRDSLTSYQQCRDNIYKIWSLSAESNLIDFFENDLKWNITEEAKDYIINKIN
jgi:hypothetical protein